MGKLTELINIATESVEQTGNPPAQIKVLNLSIGYPKS